MEARPRLPWSSKTLSTWWVNDILSSCTQLAKPTTLVKSSSPPALCLHTCHEHGWENTHLCALCPHFRFKFSNLQWALHGIWQSNASPPHPPSQMVICTFPFLLTPPPPLLLHSCFLLIFIMKYNEAPWAYLPTSTITEPRPITYHLHTLPHVCTELFWSKPLSLHNIIYNTSPSTSKRWPLH